MERLIFTPPENKNISLTEKNIPLSQTTGVILSGGLGTRMHTITGDNMPKHTLLLKRSSSILDNPIAFMRRAGLRDIYILTQDLTDGRIREYTKGNINFDGIHYLVEAYPPKGTLNAIRTLIKEKDIQTPLIKANGDEAIMNFHLEDMYSAHVKNKQPITCLLTNDSEGSEKYRLWTNSHGRVVKLSEYDILSPNQGGYSETGIWIIDPSQFYLLNQFTFWGDFVKKAIENQVLYGYFSHLRFFNINTPEDLAKARVAFG